ncbi:MAG: RNA-binding protein [Candidatus Margulisiibacteriota bacterium]|nr:RNA-binding protein [Candidatus Margulisiibacteriota bacterium]
MNIYVGNLSYQVSEEELKEEFKNFGDVKSTKIIIDRETGRSKGFGFVEMEQTEDGENAINQLNGKDLKGRNIKVNESRPKN